MSTDDNTPKSPEKANHQVADRREAARLFFRNHQAQVEPDAGFAARVVSELDRKPFDLMSSVALKLLPATLALVLILAWFVSGTPEQSVNTTLTSNDDLLLWILDDSPDDLEVEP